MVRRLQAASGVMGCIPYARSLRGNQWVGFLQLALVPVSDIRLQLALFEVGVMTSLLAIAGPWTAHTWASAVFLHCRLLSLPGTGVTGGRALAQ